MDEIIEPSNIVGEYNGILQKDIQETELQKDVPQVIPPLVIPMTRVTITETYDLSTEIDKITLIGIHTPPRNLFQSHFSGLIANHKKARIVSGDVKIACASMLPADPLQVGVEAGDIAPQDMFNPILYTAVSNDGFNNILNRLYNGLLTTEYGGSVNEEEIAGVQQQGQNFSAYDMYYGLLSWDGHFRKSMPQAGVEMRGLFPICYEVINNYGNTLGTVESQASLDQVASANDVGAPIVSAGVATTFRGNSVRMPAIPLHTQGNVSSDSKAWFPTTYVACIVMPPAKLHKLYYRMAIRWTVEFSEVISVADYQNLATLGLAGRNAYSTDYAFQSSKMSQRSDSVDVQGGNLTKVMTSA